MPGFETKIRPLKKLILAAKKLGFSDQAIDEMSEDNIMGWIEAYNEVLKPDKGNRTYKIKRKK